MACSLGLDVGCLELTVAAYWSDLPALTASEVSELRQRTGAPRVVQRSAPGRALIDACLDRLGQRPRSQRLTGLVSALAQRVGQPGVTDAVALGDVARRDFECVLAGLHGGRGLELQPLSLWFKPMALNPDGSLDLVAGWKTADASSSGAPRVARLQVDAVRARFVDVWGAEVAVDGGAYTGWFVDTQLDVDGDGVRDVVAAWIDNRQGSSRDALIIAASRGHGLADYSTTRGVTSQDVCFESGRVVPTLLAAVPDTSATQPWERSCVARVELSSAEPPRLLTLTVEAAPAARLDRGDVPTLPAGAVPVMRTLRVADPDDVHSALGHSEAWTVAVGMCPSSSAFLLQSLAPQVGEGAIVGHVAVVRAHTDSAAAAASPEHTAPSVALCPFLP
jgi:hypothetical protein